jgi:cbb3-type cytochrome oxidase cytochrome c subunit
LRKAHDRCRATCCDACGAGLHELDVAAPPALERHNTGPQICRPSCGSAIGGMVQLLSIAHEARTSTGPRGRLGHGLAPSFGARARGRDIFIRESCQYLAHPRCRIPPLLAEIMRYRTLLARRGSLHYDLPALSFWEVEAHPVLTCMCRRALQHAWHRLHTINPRSVVPVIDHPAGLFLGCEHPADRKWRIQARMRGLAKLAIPTPRGNIAGAPASAWGRPNGCGLNCLSAVPRAQPGRAAVT